MSYDSSARVNLGQIKRKVLPIFSGGYCDNCANVDLAPNLSPYLRNTRIDGTSIINRPGHALFYTVAAGSYPKGIGGYLRGVPANSVLVVRHNQDTNKKLITLTSAGVKTDISTAALITSDNKMRFIGANDVLYCFNGVDKIGKLNNTTYNNPCTGTIGTAITPSFGVMFNSSLFVSGWATNPNIVYKSVGDTPEDFDNTGSDQFTFQEPVVGLSATTQGLFYFTKNTVSVTAINDIETVGVGSGSEVNYITRVMNAKEGAVNHDSIVEVGSMVYYLTPNNNINMLQRGANINGFEEVELSQRSNRGINNIMQTLDPDQTASFGYFLPKENLIKWFVKSMGATFNDTVIIYDTIKDAFLVDSNCYFYDACVFNYKYYALSMIEPKVFIDEYGYTDENAPIPFEYDTKEYFVGDPTFKKILWESRLLCEINEMAELTQEIWIDGYLKDTKMIDKSNITDLSSGGIGTSTIGTESIGTEGELVPEMHEVILLRTKGNLNIRFKKVQWKFKMSTLASKCKLKSLSPRIEGLPPQATELTA